MMLVSCTSCVRHQASFRSYLHARPMDGVLSQLHMGDQNVVPDRQQQGQAGQVAAELEPDSLLSSALAARGLQQDVGILRRW